MGRTHFSGTSDIYILTTWHDYVQKYLHSVHIGNCLLLQRIGKEDITLISSTKYCLMFKTELGLTPVSKISARYS